MTDLWPAQQRAITELADKPRALLIAPMGAGKTRVALAASADASRIIVIAPYAAACDTWPHEVSRWTDRQPVNVAGEPTAARRLEAIARAEHGDALILNYEALRTSKILHAICRIYGASLIVDEAHRVATPSSRNLWHTHWLAKRASRVTLMTGTPFITSRGRLALWSYQAACGAPSEMTHAMYRQRYTEPTWRRGEADGSYYNGRAVQYYRYARDHEWHEELDRIAVHMPLDAAADRPSCVTVDVRAAMISTTARVFRHLAVHHTYPDGLAVPHTLARHTALRQIPAYDRAMRVHPILEDRDGRVVVFYTYRREADCAAELSEQPVYRLDGSANDVPAWRGDPRGVLFVQYQAGAEGLDLTDARIVVLMSPTTNAVLHDQAIARVHRPGQTRAVVVYQVTVDGSLDSVIQSAVQRRIDVHEAIAQYTASLEA